MIATNERAAFERLCGMVHQDIHFFATTLEERATYAVSGLFPEERPLAMTYIEKLLNSSNSISMIEQIWQQSPAQIRMTDREMLIKFLRLILKELG